MFVGDRRDPIDVQLALPDGEVFVEQAQLVGGHLWRTEPRTSMLRVQSLAHTLDEAVQKMLGRADRFGYDAETIETWQAEVVDHFASDKRQRHVRFLDLDSVGHLRLSVQLRSLPAFETVTITWTFSWDDTTLT